MRIAIFGAHNVGKTTLAEKLLERLPGYTLEIEPYHQMEFPGHGFSGHPDAEDFVDQFDYSAQLLSRSGKDVIFDRCVVDILAYLHVLDPRRDIRYLFEKAQAAIDGIDFLVFVAIETPDPIPGHRADLPKLRGRVDDLLRDWIDDLGIDAVEVSGSATDRVYQVLARMPS